MIGARGLVREVVQSTKEAHSAGVLYNGNRRGLY